MRALIPFVAACLLSSSALPVPAEPVQLPRTMSWSAYNLGTTGYNQAVAIGQALKKHYGTTLRVVPGKNDVSRLLPLVTGRVQFSANGIATYFAQEGVFQFAGSRWGPQPVRLVLTSNGDGNQALAVAADTGVTDFAGLAGRRVPYVRGAPALNVSTEALLACAGLTWADVERVEFPGYNAMWNGIVNGQVDAAYAATVSGPARKLEASPRGIRWLPVPHGDDSCWARVQRIAPYMRKHMGTRGAGLSVEAPHEGGTYPYPLLIALSATDADLVANLARALHAHYDEYKDSDPGSVGWALDRQELEWVVPFHEGAVRFFREVGVWNDALDTHNTALVRRQEVLAQAWAARTSDDEAAWMALRAERLTAAGYDPIWQ